MSVSASSSQVAISQKLLNPGRIFQGPRSDANVANLMFSFLRRDEVFGRGEEFKESLPLASVHRSWQPYFKANANLLWKSLFAEQLLPGVERKELQITESEAAGRPQINYRRAYTEAYPRVISSDLYWDKFNARAWPKLPVPENFRGENLVFHPEYLSIEIEENSTLGLDQEGKLTQDPAHHATIPSAYARPNAKLGKIELVIPNTPINISKITEMRSVEDNRTGFCNYSLRNVLEQHGNIKAASHWTAPNNKLMGLDKSFSTQKDVATEAKLQIETFADTSLFYLLTFVRSGKWPCGDDKIARTSTVVFGNGENPIAYQVTLFCETAGPSARVYLYVDVDPYPVGVPVGGACRKF